MVVFLRAQIGRFFFYDIRSKSLTRIIKNEQILIEDTEIDISSRDDIPAVLKGIQHLY